MLQVQSNALAALEAIDKDLADEIMAEGCITGDRINGLVDGETGKWYVSYKQLVPTPGAKFDTGFLYFSAQHRVSFNSAGMSSLTPFIQL